MEKISIIVPVYNSERTLKACIESLINQTYQYLDIILIDDGSTDKSSIICDKFAGKDSRIRVVHKKNGGVVSARNIGISMLPKEGFAAFCDSDDFMEKNSIEKLYKCAISTKADMVCGNLQRFLKRNIKLKKTIPPILSRECCFEGAKIYPEILPSFFGITNFPGYMHTKLYRNVLLKKVKDLKYPELKFQEDIAFNLLYVLTAKKIAVIPDIIYYYRVGGVTSRYMPSFLSDCIELYKIKMEIIEKKHLSEDMRYTTSIELKNECSFWLQMKLEYLISKRCPEKILDEIEYCCNIPEIIRAVNYPKEDNSGIVGFKELVKNKEYAQISDLLLQQIKKNRVKNMFKHILMKFV